MVARSDYRVFSGPQQRDEQRAIDSHALFVSIGSILTLILTASSESLGVQKREKQWIQNVSHKKIWRLVCKP